jgi:hypothetical protein
MNEKQQQSDMVLLTGLWLNTPKSGRDKYMAGYLGIGGRVLIFKNGKKRAEKDPDYFMYLAPNDRDRDAADANRRQTDDGDDVPF